MKVICDRGALLDLLNLTGGVIAARTPKPALTCVKLEAGENTLTVTATDLEVGLRVSTSKVEVRDGGEALIPADKLHNIVRESVDPTLELNVTANEATIRGADSRFKVFGYAPGEFPDVPQMKGDADFEIGAQELHRLIAQTIFATARENSRWAFNGVLLERDGNKLVVVGTDGRRLALARGTCKPATDGEARIQAIVPTKALNMIIRLFSDAEQTVRVKIANNQIIFATDEAMLASNLIEGNFPPYKDVIPKDGDKKATLHTDAFASGIRRAALLTNEESKGVRLSFATEGLTLTSRAPEMGEAEVKVEMPKYEGEPLEIGFQPQFLLDVMKVVDASEFTFELRAPNKSGLIRTGSDFLYVIMPVTLQ